MSEYEVAALASVLQESYGHVIPRADYGWAHPPLNVLICVLSLNRLYSPMEQRVIKFQNQHKSLTSLRSLTDLINEYPSPLDFATRELNYRDGARAQTILGVARYLMGAQRGRDGCTEHERIASWAAAVKPSDSGSVGVHGFGLPGFQYLRMLFGVQTCKPDIYTVRFVRDVVGRKVDDRTALQLLEAAAQRARLPLREVDNVIWSEGRKRPSRCGTKGEFKT